MNEIFLNNVRRVMEERNIDNQALAEKCGWVRETVDRLFRRNIPLKLDMAVNIADALETTVDKLCGRQTVTEMNNMDDFTVWLKNEAQKERDSACEKRNHECYGCPYEEDCAHE